jgi:predicted phosphodiesterase
MKLQETKTVKDGTVISVYMPGANLADFEQPILATSDIHADSIYCDTQMFVRDMKRADTKGAWVTIAGDLFDAMQARKDPRGRPEEMRSEFVGKSNYFDVIVDYVYELLKPYQHMILLIGKGNHEYSVMRHNETDLVQRLIGILNSGQNHKIVAGGYVGWVRFMYQSNKRTPQGSVNYVYNHGFGGDAPVTKGTIQTNRQAASLEGVDVVHNGHNHNEYYLPIPKERLNNKGKVEVVPQIFIRTPGYKNTFENDLDGSSWERQGGNPKPLGSIYFTIGNLESRNDRHPGILSVEKLF